MFAARVALRAPRVAFPTAQRALSVQAALRQQQVSSSSSIPDGMIQGPGAPAGVVRLLPFSLLLSC